ncbi:MAG: nucleotidyltransferase family protein [Chloroflexi bacterium]|nr:nucleotidyltransferase family protein [Chloroflexota bacterium]
MPAKIAIPIAEIEDFCRKHHIRKLSLFGSVLRDDFREDSDVDVLVEFVPGKGPGLIRLAGMERELSELLGGRKADLRTPEDLSPYFRDEVLREAEPLYVET